MRALYKDLGNIGNVVPRIERESKVRVQRRRNLESPRFLLRRFLRLRREDFFSKCAKTKQGFERFDTTETGIWTVEVVRRRSIHYAKSAIKEGMKYASRAPVSYHQVEENLPFPCETNGEKPLHRA